MRSSYILVILAIFLSVSLTSGKIPRIDPKDYPVPGKFITEFPEEDDVIILHEYKYERRGYSIKTHWVDGKFHKANGTLVDSDEGPYFVEEGEYTDVLPDSSAFYVKYKIDLTGYTEYTRDEFELEPPRLSSKAIAGILG